MGVDAENGGGQTDSDQYLADAIENQVKFSLLEDAISIQTIEAAVQ